MDHGTKTCQVCKRCLPVQEYGKNRSRPDGLQTACKPCTRVRVNASRSKRLKPHECPVCGITVTRDPRYAWTQCADCARKATSRARRTVQCTDLVLYVAPTVERVVAEETRVRFAYAQCRCGAHVLSDLRRGSSSVNCSAPCRRRANWSRRRALKKSAKTEDVRDLVVYERDHWMCHICDTLIDAALHGLRGWQPLGPSLDHVFPLARGGSHSYDNIKAAHRLCNSTKRDTV